MDGQCGPPGCNDSEILIAMCRLCDIRLTSVKTPLGLESVPINRNTGDFSEGGLAAAVNKPPINSLVVHTWRDKAGMN